MILALSSPGWADLYLFGVGNEYTANTAFGPFAGNEGGPYNGYNFPNSGDYEFTVYQTDGTGVANTSIALVEAALEARYGGDFTLFSITTYITNAGAKSGEWATYTPVDDPEGAGDFVSFYAVKASNMFALYAVAPPDDYGTWNVENVLTGGGTVPNISHLAGFFSEGTPNGKVPEPATMLLLGSGLVGLAGYGKKKIKK